MGDFVIYNRKKVSADTQAAAIKTLSAQGSKNPRILNDDSYTILIYEKSISPVCNFIQTDCGDYCISSGSFFYRGAHGITALRQFLVDFDPDHYRPNGFLGIFTLIIKKNGRLFVLTDPLGGSRVFHNIDHSLWSSSFLALAENISGLTIDGQGVYEYAFQEASYGATTPVNEIRMADSLKYFELTKDGTREYSKNIPISFEQSNTSYEDLIEEHSNLLQNQMQSVVSSYGPKIATALSGGYDSRLMLSLARNTGVIPKVYVYGADNSPDVTVAKSVGEGEGIAIDHINKATHPKPSVDNYGSIVKDNFYALDGFPNEGIFDFLYRLRSDYLGGIWSAF